MALLQCSSHLPPGPGHGSAPGSGEQPCQGRSVGILKATMLLSPPPRGRCKQWGQTGSQTLGRGNWRLGLVLRSLQSVGISEAGLRKVAHHPLPPRSCSASSGGHSTPSQRISVTQEVAPMLRVGAGAYHRWTLTLAEAGAGSGSCAAEAAGGRAVADHVLLRLKQDDVQLGCKQTAEHHRATETYRHAHGGGLHLQWERSRMSLSQGLDLAPGTLPKWWGPSSGDHKHPALGLGPFAKSQRIFRKVGHSPSISFSAPSSRKTKVLAVGLG